MALTWRVSFPGTGSLPEDYFSSALGVIFPDDVTNQHGDPGQGLIYTSPELPNPLAIELADPVGDTDRRLFSHHLWNSSLLLAEFVERDTLNIIQHDQDQDLTQSLGSGINFNVKDLHILELGAGTALPSIMSALLGAQRLVITDYPAPAVIKTLRGNVARNIQPENSPRKEVTSDVVVEGHAWGELDGPFCTANKHAFDRLFVADCIWMPWQHANLHRSIAHFLKDTPDACAWIIGGFHTGRQKMRGFFDADALQLAGLEVEQIWERDCDGVERSWSWDREDHITGRKRWLVVASLRRIPRPATS